MNTLEEVACDTRPTRPHMASPEVFHADHASTRVRHLHCVSRHPSLPLGAVAVHGIWESLAVQYDHSGTQGDGGTCDHRGATRAPGCLSGPRGHAPGPLSTPVDAAQGVRAMRGTSGRQGGLAMSRAGITLHQHSLTQQQQHAPLVEVALYEQFLANGRPG
jgi:hypothetical protein